MKALFDGCTLKREAGSWIWFFVLLEASGDDPESMLPPVRTLESEVEDGQRHSGFAEHDQSELRWCQTTRSCSSQPYSVYFDNFFTSFNLMAQLSHLSFKATGTVRDNRTGRCPLTPVSVMAKGKRGSFDYRFDNEEKILMVRWHDNSVVTVATNFDTVEPLASCKRWSKESTCQVDVQQPKLIKNYNINMGGIDIHDWHAGKFGIHIRGKRWYWPLFIRSIDMAAVNAWILHRVIHGESAMDQEFRRHITASYLHINLNRKLGRPSITRPPVVFEDIRYDRIGHLIRQRQEQRRCQREMCKGKPTFYCVKCSVTLCPTCFYPYHTKWQ